ncbi:uncharacterized protein LOC134288698 [Aedes albopictus]|uniref:Integrase catalytic domain-containing protein n=1 Tax=Aedes albopictus TaxID=7160 RepID=A0ABM1YVB9_AEDAL
MARVLRFVANCRLKSQHKPSYIGPFTNGELLAAESRLIHIAQQDEYSRELHTLQTTELLPKSNALHKLLPWIDDRGIMRMRTRIAACQYATEDAKSPIILPRNHVNHETVINELRQKYQIARLRTCYAQVRRNCQRCKNERAVPNIPVMADLPPGRLEAFSRPFTHVGIDYFGPIEVVVGRRHEKRWGMLATCLTTRAIHIELVNSLSTDSCIMAIRNFVARRGQPRKIYSDRGTNFVGANRELQRLQTVINYDEMMREFTTEETEWVFNPPLAPHMGGSWERLIRTVKSNLMAICSTKTLTDEVLRNLLAEVENVVNSRPLTHVPLDNDSAPALTPNHFLLGSSCGSKPLVNLDDSARTLQQNMTTSQILANRYWKRWVADYLPEITRRSKWFQPVKPIATGDVVIIVDPRTPRNCWSKERVIATTPSRDGHTRSATVQTTTGIYERPTAKMAVLDVQRVEQCKKHPAHQDWRDDTEEGDDRPSTRHKLILDEKVLVAKVQVGALTVKATLQCKNLDEITDPEKLAAALKQQCEVDAPSASIHLRKGPAGTQITTIELPVEEVNNKATAIGKIRVGW